MPTTKVYISVPYAEKDEAKSLGARWDPTQKQWFVPSTTHPAYKLWPPLPPLDFDLPGEDRQFGSGLYVDLIPQSAWNSNVRSMVSTQDWDRVRKMVYERANYHCEVCHTYAKGSLDAHERWDYSNPPAQRLRRLLALCKNCHLATHFGYATTAGKEHQALQHLQTVNNWSAEDATRHVQEAYRVWAIRSAEDWDQDISLLSAPLQSMSDTNSHN